MAKIPTVLLAVLFLACPLAKAQLVIDPTFGNSITSLPNASTVEATIDAGIAQLEAAIETPITVNIDFEDNTSIALGMSDTYFNDLSYSQYRTDLVNLSTHSANQLTALASLPIQPNNPVNGNVDVFLSLPLLRAIGETALGDNSGDPNNLDSTISLNIPETNVSRTGPQNPSDFDLEAVAMHEMDEVLGIGGEGSAISGSGAATTGPVGALDLYRYTAPNNRSFTTSTNATAYFSINSGTTNIVYFNQSPDGDFGDWGDGVSPADDQPSIPPFVQDAFCEPGVDINLGAPELTALNVEGYELAAVPEPKDVGLLVIGSLAVLGAWRRLVRSV